MINAAIELAVLYADDAFIAALAIWLANDDAVSTFDKPDAVAFVVNDLATLIADDATFEYVPTTCALYKA